MTVQEWKRYLNLQSHPEGGSYARNYLASESIPAAALPARFDGDRPFSSAIYFLLEERAFSALHRLRQDELWHFYDGTTLLIHIIEPDGQYRQVRLGRNPVHGEALMALVPAGVLFGAEVVDKTSFTLAGCTLAPAFDFADFEMPSRDQLLEQFPQHRQLIVNLT